MSRRCLTIRRFLEVDVGIPEGAAGYDIAAHANGQDAAGLVEFLEQHCFVHVGMEVAYVERGDGVVSPAGRHQHGHLESLFLRVFVSGRSKNSCLLCCDVNLPREVS